MITFTVSQIESFSQYIPEEIVTEKLIEAVFALHKRVQLKL